MSCRGSHCLKQISHWKNTSQGNGHDFQGVKGSLDVKGHDNHGGKKGHISIQSEERQRKLQELYAKRAKLEEEERMSRARRKNRRSNSRRRGRRDSREQRRSNSRGNRRSDSRSDGRRHRSSDRRRHGDSSGWSGRDWGSSSSWKDWNDWKRWISSKTKLVLVLLIKLKFHK